MTFAHPLALWLVLLGPAAVVALARYAARRRREGLSAFLGPHAHAAADPGRRRRTALQAAAVACLALALAGPEWGRTTRETRQESLDLVVALDVSESMQAEDVAPSRLERAKLAIRRIVDERPGDRVGLVVFAGEAFLQCPLTTDRNAFRLFLNASEPSLVPLQGTDLAAALGVAQMALEETETAEARPRAVVVVSDGETHEGGESGAAEALRESGAAVLAIGVGTDEGGPIPDGRRTRFGPEYKTDAAGERIVTRYEPAALRAVAGRGDVFRLDARGGVADDVVRELDRLDRVVMGAGEVEAEAQRYQWPLALGLLLLLAERWLASRRREAVVAREIA